jgi:ubiquinone/menaquinone biosynthesis C-methylase UbiE
MTMETTPTLAADKLLAVENAYDMTAPFYDDWKWQQFWRAAELPFIKDCFLEINSKVVPDLLDVGCGTGWYLRNLKGLYAEATGIDASRGMLAQARLYLPQADLRFGDVRHLPFGNGRFDVVLSTRVLSHLPNPRQAIEQVARVLKLVDCI